MERRAAFQYRAKAVHSPQFPEPTPAPPVHVKDGRVTFLLEDGRKLGLGTGDRVELVTDNAKDLRAQPEAATGERIAALEGICEMGREARDKAMEPTRPAR